MMQEYALVEEYVLFISDKLWDSEGTCLLSDWRRIQKLARELHIHSLLHWTSSIELAYIYKETAEKAKSKVIVWQDNL